MLHTLVFFINIRKTDFQTFARPPSQFHVTVPAVLNSLFYPPPISLPPSPPHSTPPPPTPRLASFIIIFSSASTPPLPPKKIPAVPSYLCFSSPVASSSSIAPYATSKNRWRGRSKRNYLARRRPKDKRLPQGVTRRTRTRRTHTRRAHQPAPLVSANGGARFLSGR